MGFYCGCFTFFKSNNVLIDCLLQGEKYLVLKKKYRQMLHERYTKHQGTDGDGQRHSRPARPSATVLWDVTDASTSSSHQKEPQDEPMPCREPDSDAEVNRFFVICKNSKL